MNTNTANAALMKFCVCLQVGGFVTYAAVQPDPTGNSQGVAVPVNFSWQSPLADIDIDPALPATGTCAQTLRYRSWHETESMGVIC